MAHIPRLKEDSNVMHLPGINPKDYQVDDIEKPTTYKEALQFLRDKKICKVTQKWNEDVDILTMSLKASGDEQDGEVRRSVEVIPGSLERSADEIIRSAQELWAYRHLVVMKMSLLEVVEGANPPR